MNKLNKQSGVQSIYSSMSSLFDKHLISYQSIYLIHAFGSQPPEPPPQGNREAPHIFAVNPSLLLPHVPHCRHNARPGKGRLTVAGPVHLLMRQLITGGYGASGGGSTARHHCAATLWRGCASTMGRPCGRPWRATPGDGGRGWLQPTSLYLGHGGHARCAGG